MKRFLIGFCFSLIVGLSWEVSAYNPGDLEKIRGYLYIKCSGCDLSWANLEHANLKEANLERAFMIGVNLEQANLTGAIFCYTTMPDGTKNNKDC